MSPQNAPARLDDRTPSEKADGTRCGRTMNQPTLETERLILRPFSMADAKDVQRLAGRRAIADTTLNIPYPYEDGVAEAWIESHPEALSEGTSVTFAITRKADGVLVGAIGLADVVAGHQASLGYWIGEPFWRSGYCTEAARAVVAYAFGTLGLARVHACHFGRNPASGRVMEKIGMTYEGRRRQHVRKWGAFEDVELYGIIRSDDGATSQEPERAR